jgi:hypothetical protein
LDSILIPNASESEIGINSILSTLQIGHLGGQHAEIFDAHQKQLLQSIKSTILYFLIALGFWFWVELIMA